MTGLRAEGIIAVMGGVDAGVLGGVKRRLRE